MGIEADVVVIGAGIVGTAAALELIRRGRRVVVVDCNRQAGRGSTAYSLAMIRFHASTLDATALAYEGYGWWTHWREWLGMDTATAIPVLRRTGTLLLDVGDGYVDRVVPHLSSLGINHQCWDRAEMARRFPYLDHHLYGVDLSEPAGWLDGALYTPGSGYIDDPILAVANIVDAFCREGGELRLGQTVTAVHSDGGGRLAVQVRGANPIFATSVLCAAGPQSRRLLAACRVLDDFTVLPAPLRHNLCFATVEPEILGDASLTHVVDNDLGINFRPDGTYALLGGLQQSAGTLGDPREEGWPTTDPPDRAMNQEALLRLSARIPGLRVPPRPTGMVGYYDVSTDWSPIYDCTSMPGFFVAAGTSGTQLKTAPMVGHMLAELISACQDGHDHDADPLRVRGRYVDHHFSLAPFSRLRSPLSTGAQTING